LYSIYTVIVILRIANPDQLLDRYKKCRMIRKTIVKFSTIVKWIVDCEGSVKELYCIITRKTVVEM
jgi:hypothetical protein